MRVFSKQGFCLLFVFFMGSAFVSPRLWALNYKTLEPGLDYAELAVQNEAKSTLHILRIDLKKFNVKPIEARDYSATSLSVKTMSEKSGALAVLNANFFDPQRKALGLILKDGVVKNSFKNISWWGVFLLNKSYAKIAKLSQEAEAKGFEQGVQAGPRLVVKGSPMKLKSEFSAKSAIGLDAKNRVYLIASQGSVEINELAKFLAKSLKSGGLGLTDALNLDGGSSTQFFVKRGEFQRWVPAFATVPVGLGVFRR